MLEKFEFYDLLGIAVPGTLLIYGVAAAFPQITALTVELPDAIDVIAFVAGIVFVGHLMQALASLIEPVLFWTWRGRPSERALKQGLGSRLPLDSAVRIRRKLAAKVGAEASDRSLFLYAMQHAEGSGASRVAKFNGLYAYHRALLVLVFFALLLVFFSAQFGTLRAKSASTSLWLIIAGLGLLILIWHRTRQRAHYYVREVLLTAERVLDQSG